MPVNRRIGRHIDIRHWTMNFGRCQSKRDRVRHNQKLRDKKIDVEQNSKPKHAKEEEEVKWINFQLRYLSPLRGRAGIAHATIRIKSETRILHLLSRTLHYVLVDVDYSIALSSLICLFLLLHPFRRLPKSRHTTSFDDSDGGNTGG